MLLTLNGGAELSVNQAAQLTGWCWLAVVLSMSNLMWSAQYLCFWCVLPKLPSYGTEEFCYVLKKFGVGEKWHTQHPVSYCHPKVPLFENTAETKLLPHMAIKPHQPLGLQISAKGPMQLPLWNLRQTIGNSSKHTAIPKPSKCTFQKWVQVPALGHTWRVQEHIEK